jgi:predicted ester cyclase
MQQQIAPILNLLTGATRTGTAKDMTMSMAATKRSLHAALSALAEAPEGQTMAHLSAIADPEALWRFSHPINVLAGSARVAAGAIDPLKQALPDLERRDLIVVGGTFEGRSMVAMMGHYCGTFQRDWLGIPAHGRLITLRYGEVFEVEGGRIVAAHCLWDILDFIRQAGHWPVAPSLGVEGAWPGPFTGDGLVFNKTDPAQSAQSLAQTLAMHRTLGDYNDSAGLGRDGLLVMPQRDHWHPRMMWYGPSGIGSTRGLAGFVDHHQLPFRIAFPNRKGGSQWDELAEDKQRLGGGHFIQIGDGPYSVTGGWPSVIAHHTGGGFMGLPPTGRIVTMRVMDFYLHHEGLIRENWVPIDLLDLLLQMGIDVMARLQDSLRIAR